jgi:hypothetical protein
MAYLQLYHGHYLTFTAGLQSQLLLAMGNKPLTLHDRNLSKSRLYVKVKQSAAGLEWPRGFQEVKVPRLNDNGTGWW